jgi:hypothetical protein
MEALDAFLAENFWLSVSIAILIGCVLAMNGMGSGSD